MRKNQVCTRCGGKNREGIIILNIGGQKPFCTDACAEAWLREQESENPRMADRITKAGSLLGYFLAVRRGNKGV